MIDNKPPDVKKAASIELVVSHLNVFHLTKIRVIENEKKKKKIGRVIRHKTRLSISIIFLVGDQILYKN